MFKAEGDVVEDGEVVGAISDPFGESEVEVVARNGGIIVGRAVMPVVYEGDALLHIAAVKSSDVAEAAVGIWPRNWKRRRCLMKTKSSELVCI